MQVRRVRKTLWHSLYLGPVVSGLMVTLRHRFLPKDTLQYPEQTRPFGERYRGVPALVEDQDGHAKCVACYMCQFVCPPRAITIEAGEYPEGHPQHQIEKRPERFEINMLRCMIFDKEKLYRIGGTRHDEIKKWSPERKGPQSRSHVSGDQIAPATAGKH